MMDKDTDLKLEAAYLAGFQASGEGYNGEYPFGDHNRNPEHDPVWCKDRDNKITAIKQARSEPVQEPVAWQDTAKPSEIVDSENWDNIDPQWHWMYRPLYTTPPAAQRTWVGLTPEKIAAFWPYELGQLEKQFAFNLEAELKKENT
jgi:hypothetical protein